MHNRLIFTLPTGTPTFLAPSLSPPEANIQFPYLVFINNQVAKIVIPTHHKTDAGTPVANGVPSCLKAINPKDPSHVKTPLKASAEKIQAIGSFSMSTLKPGTCVLPVINLVNASVAPLKMNNIASVTIKDGRPVLTTKIPFA